MGVAQRAKIAELRAYMKFIVGMVCEHGARAIIKKIKDKQLRRSGYSACKACTGRGFEKEYWNCIECRMVWILIDRHLQEEGLASGSKQVMIQNEIDTACRKDVLSNMGREVEPE